MKKLLMGAALALFMSGSALAQDFTTTTATVNIQGVLEMGNMTGTLDFGTRSPGDNDVPPIAGPNLVVDFRDTTSSAGNYHMTVQSTDFSNGAGIIPATGFEIENNGVSAITITDNDGSGTETPPTVDPALAGGFPLDQEVLLFEATQDSGDPTAGKGAWVLSIQPSAFTLDIPNGIPSGVYTATMTFTINPGLFGP